MGNRKPLTEEQKARRRARYAKKRQIAKDQAKLRAMLERAEQIEPEAKKMSRALTISLLFTSIVVICLLIFGAFALVHAESTTTFRARAGNVTGYSHTDYAGNTTFRDRGRNVVG
jgi:hypothetical protein